ncbi:MAG TPA: SIS domain-containing protein [Candidatus Woesebacteria bacterium]|nr:SIS domain-containing protein [Candidatus Woesebacteria bacterium]
MCGILAASYKEAHSLTDISRLIKNMEYRGYDSWGLVTVDKKTKLYRGVGRLKDENINGESRLLLAHTRWATHGGIKIKNCHPFASCKKNLWLVHNGIVENYLELKKEKHLYTSETDSEVMVHYLEAYKDIDTGIRNLAKMIVGKNSLVVLDKKSRALFGFRRGSPLIVGKGDGVAQIVSDSVAFDKKINKIYHLNNEEMVTIDKEQNIEISSLAGDKNIITKWEKFMAGDNKNVEGMAMYKEIIEGLEVAKKIDKENILIEDFKKEISKAKEIILLGCGSASVAAEMGARLIADKLHKKANAYSASEVGEIIDSFDKKALVIVLSQSGETMDLIEVTEIFLKKDFRVIGMINNPLSTLARMVEKYYPLLAEKEVAVVATKSFLAMIYWFLKVTKTEEKIIYKENEAQEMAIKLKDSDKLLIIGRGESLILAKEAAIKLKEACYIQAEAIGGGELKHGPLALIEKKVLVLSIGAGLQNDRAEILARGGKVLEINRGGIINNLLFIQLLTFFLAKNRNINPDRPRNLAKSVTVR